MNREAKNAVITLSNLNNTKAEIFWQTINCQKIAEHYTEPIINQIMKNSTSTKNTSKKNSARTSRQINEAAPLGSRENPYKSSIRLKGRSFVMDETGEWREMDQDGNLIPDKEVKPL